MTYLLLTYLNLSIFIKNHGKFYLQRFTWCFVKKIFSGWIWLKVKCFKTLTALQRQRGVYLKNRYCILCCLLPDAQHIKRVISLFETSVVIGCTKMQLFTVLTLVFAICGTFLNGGLSREISKIDDIKESSPVNYVTNDENEEIT